MSPRLTARSAPAFILAVCLVVGLLVGSRVREEGGSGLDGLNAIAFVCSAALTILFLAFATRRGAAGFTLIALPVVTVQGCLMGLVGDPGRADLRGLHMRHAAAVGTVAGPPQVRRDRTRCALRCERLLLDGRWRFHDAVVLATIVWSSKDSLRHEIRFGDRIALSGTVLLPSPPRNPGEMDARRWYAANGYSHDLLARGARSVRLLGRGDANWLHARIVDPVRRAAVESIDAGYTGQGREFLKGLLLGIRDGIDARTQEAFVNAGVAHILAVSGSNVAVVAAIALFMLGVIRCPLRYAPIPLVLVLLLYMLVTGSQPPVVRATVMALLVIGGRLLQRRVSGVNVIGAAALIALIDAPRLLDDVGFQLSFTAVLSLMLVYPAVDRRILGIRLRGPLRAPLVWTLRLAGVSLVATLGTLPITALSFGRLSIVGVAANVPVVPLSGVSVVLGAAAMLSRWFVLPLAPPIEAVNGLVLDITLAVARIAGGLPWASVDTSSWTALHVIPMFVAAGALLSPAAGRPRRLLSLATLASLALLALLARPSVLETSRRELRVWTIDVGQGDAVLVQFPGDTAMLVDAGPRTPAFDSGRRVIAPLLRRLGVDRLTYLVLTHAHGDHTGGCSGVLGSVPVDSIFVSPWMGPVGALPVRRLVAGTSFSPTVDSRVYVLWPDGAAGPPVPAGGVRADLMSENNRSIVLKVVFGEFSVLLAGDAEAAVEVQLVERYGSFLRSNLVKVGHHGSSSSSSEAFLRSVRPELAIVSVGALNRFGHPSPGVIQRYGRMSSCVARTDRDGCVAARTDGRGWERVRWRDP